MISQTFVEEMKEKLLATKAELEQELAGLPTHTEMGDDEEDNAEEVEIDDVNRGIAARVKQDLEKIEKALSKIESGTYGTDDEGKEISEERLRALPWADRAI